MPNESPSPVLERDPLVQRFFTLTRSLIRVGYFSFEVEGMERVPREGRVVYALNHAGWFPLDAFFLTLAIAEAQGLARAPCFATVDAALAAPGLGVLLRRFGALPASWFRRPERLPPSVESVGMFPEGVRGNTKPFWEAYRMHDWNRGFVRVALARRAPVVPVAVLGGEESLPVAWTVRLLEPLIGEPVGLPVSWVPLPAHWKIVFHEPVVLERGPDAASDHGYCSAVARRLQAVVQATLDREAAGRPLGKLSRRLTDGVLSRGAAPDGGPRQAALPAEDDDPLDETRRSGREASHLTAAPAPR